MALDTDTDIEIFGRRIPVNPPGSPDPGDGDTDITRSTGFQSEEPGGPTPPIEDEATIFPQLLIVAPPGPFAIPDPPEVQLLSGLNLFAPEDAQIPADIALDPGGTLFDKPIEENPDGAMSLPAVNQTEEVTIGDGILNRSSAGIAPLPDVDQSVEITYEGQILRKAPPGTPSISEPEVRDDGHRFARDSFGVNGPVAIDQSTTVEIGGRRLNFGS